MTIRIRRVAAAMLIAVSTAPILVGCSSTPSFSDLSPECQDLMETYENAQRQWRAAMEAAGDALDIEDESEYADELGFAVDDMDRWGRKRDDARSEAAQKCPPEWSTILISRGGAV